MKNKLVIYLLTILSISSSCTEGCLKCDQDKNCLICDYHNFYILEKQTCIKKELENCEVIDYEGNCLLCVNDYYLDHNHCAAVPETNLVENCQIYFSESTCLKCATGFYNNANKCEVAIVAIDGCEFHNEDGKTCQKCQSGRIKTLDNKLCLQIDSQPECATFNYIDCQVCKANHFFTRNDYLFDSVAELKSGESYSKIREHLKQRYYNISQSNWSSCAKVKIGNCSQLENSSKCLVCENGFYLTDDKTCKEFPEDIVPFCEVYISKTDCSQCQNGYYMKTTNTCEKSEEILNCKNYNRNNNKTCDECEDGYFSEGERCVDRVISLKIEKCDKLSNLDDFCEKCIPGQETNLDKSKCFPVITFCSLYIKQNDKLECDKCIDKYYLENNKCSVGEIDNCLVYNSKHECKECLNGFQLQQASKCIAHPLFDHLNCKSSNSFKLNKCEECDKTRVKIQANGFCTQVETIRQNCDVYLNKDTCNKCNSTFTYLENGNCKLGEIQNCIEYSKNQNLCIKCKIEGTLAYVPSPANTKDNSCVLANLNPSQNCEEIQLTLSSQIECVECEKNYYPLTFQTKQLHFCVPKSYHRFVNTAPTENCLFFDLNNNKCVRCEDHKVLSSNGTCEDNCEANQFVKFIEINEELEDGFINHYKKCLPRNQVTLNTFQNTQLECDLFINALNNNNLFYCAKCSLNNQNVSEMDFSLSGKLIALDYKPLTIITSYYQYNRILPILRCLSREITTTGETNGSQTAVIKYLKDALEVPASLDNCRFVMKIGTTLKYACVACDHGYSGKIVKDVGNEGFFIDKCTLIENCLATKYYAGLGSLDNQINPSLKLPLTFFVSCHVCAGSQIPTFGRTSEAITNAEFSDTITYPNSLQYFLAPFGIPLNDATVPYKAIITTQTSCQENGIGYKIVLNCAIQQILINKTLKNLEIYSELINPRCVACSPGYEPILTSTFDNSKYISECKTILNCDINNTQSFNRCDSCAGKFALLYNSEASNGLTDALSCVFANNSNCHVYNEDESKCVRCRKGSMMNPDGICEKVNLYQCDQVSFLDKSSRTFLLNFTPFGGGCLQCKENYIGLKFDDRQKQCVASSYLQTGESFTTSLVLIKNCVSYTFDSGQENKTTCVECVLGFILNQNHTFCFETNSDLKNCLKYNAQGNKCFKCANNYYVNDNGNCIEGKIANCQQYQSQTECVICKEEFSIIRINSNQVKCFKTPDLNCEVFDQVAFNEGYVNCQKCKKNFFYNTDIVQVGELPLWYCLLIPEITNCLKYDNQPDLSEASLNCDECVQSFYVNNFVCQKRINYPITNCNVYEEKKDGCKECKTGYYINENMICKVFPKGVKDCEQYISESDCSKCKPGRYLEDKLCELIPPELEIKNCVYYKQSKECQECQWGYYQASPNSCIEAVANNCQTYVSESICETCPNNFGLVASNDLVQCEKIQIENCEQSNQILDETLNKFTCHRCKISFYINSEGSCTAVPKLINFCAYYRDSINCELCLDGYILSKDRKSCSKEFQLLQYSDTNCLNPKELANPICNTCKDGYFFKDDQSTECVKCNDQLEEGCMFCDPNATIECQICKSGYFMDMGGKCQGNVVETTEIVVSSFVFKFELIFVGFWFLLWF